MDPTDAQRSSANSAPAHRLRCVHFLRSVRLEEGGVVRAVLDICGALAARGQQVTLVTCDATDVPPEWKADSASNPKTLVVANGQIDPVAQVLAQADVLHLHTPWERMNVTVARIARRQHVPYVVSIHGMLDDWSMRQKTLKKRLYLAVIGRRFLANAASVHCTARAELEQASRYLRPGSGVVVPLPIDLAGYTTLPGKDEALAAFPGISAGVPRVLFLSRLHPKKRPDLVIEAAARLRAEARPVQALLAGPGESQYVESLRNLVRRHGLEQYVTFPGMVRGTLKVSLYQSADAFVLPTSQENFGYVLIESLAAGTPVITTRGVDIHEELQRAGAVIVEPEPEALASAITSLLEDLSKARQIGQRGREWVFGELSPEHVVAGYEQMYLNAIDRAPRTV